MMKPCGPRVCCVCWGKCRYLAGRLRVQPGALFRSVEGDLPAAQFGGEGFGERPRLGLIEKPVRGEGPAEEDPFTDESHNPGRARCTGVLVLDEQVIACRDEHGCGGSGVSNGDSRNVRRWSLTSNMTFRRVRVV